MPLPWVFRHQHDGHSVVHSAYEWIWLSYNHRGGQNFLASQPCELPEASKGERLEVFAPKAIRLLPVVALL
ncbi:MAG: hypothetical protein WB662_08625 [Methyloceanibacter sp.]|jgi:hypothetical protein